MSSASRDGPASIIAQIGGWLLLQGQPPHVWQQRLWHLRWLTGHVSPDVAAAAADVGGQLVRALVRHADELNQAAEDCDAWGQDDDASHARAMSQQLRRIAMTEGEVAT